MQRQSPQIRLVCGLVKFLPMHTYCAAHHNSRNYRARLKGGLPDLVNYVTALAYFCLALPAAFTQPGDQLLAEPSHFAKLYQALAQRRLRQ